MMGGAPERARNGQPQGKKARKSGTEAKREGPVSEQMWARRSLISKPTLYQVLRFCRILLDFILLVENLFDSPISILNLCEKLD